MWLHPILKYLVLFRNAKYFLKDNILKLTEKHEVINKNRIKLDIEWILKFT
jgi:hypothetical protein